MPCSPYSIEKWTFYKSEQNVTKWNIHVFNKSPNEKSENQKIDSKACVQRNEKEAKK